jgi:hypothetical protein
MAAFNFGLCTVKTVDSQTMLGIDYGEHRGTRGEGYGLDSPFSLVSDKYRIGIIFDHYYSCGSLRYTGKLPVGIDHVLLIRVKFHP